MIDYKTIGRKIRERRIACNLSQEKLAELCDVGTTHISHIETFPKSHVSYRKPRKLSEEQREQARERMKNINGI